jgi:hypothetical protein
MHFCTVSDSYEVPQSQSRAFGLCRKNEPQSSSLGVILLWAFLAWLTMWSFALESFLSNVEPRP